MATEIWNAVLPLASKSPSPHDEYSEIYLFIDISGVTQGFA